jgi:hypothetical protein
MPQEYGFPPVYLRVKINILADFREKRTSIYGDKFILLGFQKCATDE